MPNAFNGYCYSTIIEAANAEISTPTQISQGGAAAATSFTSTTSTAGNLTFTFKAFGNTAAANYVLNRQYPSCSSVGQLSNNSGVSVVDALAVSWSVVLVWLAAYYFKSFRTGVRGY